MKQVVLSLVVVVVMLAVSWQWPVMAATKSTQLELKAELKQSVLPANRRQNAIIKISIAAPEMRISPHERKVKVNVAIVLDKSGSMQNSRKIENAKKAAITALRMLDRDDLFSFIVYDTQARVIVPSSKVIDKDRIEGMINSVHAGGSTALFAGVSLGANELRKFARDGYVNRLILLSDGLANVGPSSPEALGRLGSSLIKERISVSTVGVGNDYNEDLMTGLSQNSDGNFYFVENSNDLPMIFSKELGSALRVAATSLTIHIEFPKGIKPHGVLGHDYRIDDNKMDIFFNQVYGGHEKSLILQVEVPPEKADRSIELASISMNYEDAVSGRKYQSRRAVMARTSASNDDVLRSTNQKVVEDYSLMNTAVLKQQAIEKADKGKYNEAQKLLNQAAKELERTARQTGNKKLQEEASKNYRYARELKAKPVPKVYFKQRKRMRGESYQTINDQMFKQ